MDAYVWILVINVISLLPGDLHLPSSRTRGLTEEACLILAQEVRGPKTIAYCYRDGEPDPGWHRPSKPQRQQGDECRPPPGRRWV
jgi:hypothetical protein